MSQPTLTELPAAGPAPAFLRLNGLSDQEDAVRNLLLGQLSRARRANARQQAYYEGSRMVRDLGIAIPPHLLSVLEAVTGMPEIVVDVLDERMNWLGWTVDGAVTGPQIDDSFDLGELATQNQLQLKVAEAVLDALIHGVGFLTAGTGEPGEPEVLFTAESPSRMTATWDRRLSRCVNGLVETFDDYGRGTGWVLWLPDQTITLGRERGRVTVLDRDEHGSGRVPIVMLRNRARTDRVEGRSEITRAVRSATDSAMRTLCGAEVAREFYAAPQRYLMGADESMFVDQDGAKKSAWEAVIGRILMAPRDDNGDLPTPGTFAAASPQPFTELLKMYAQMVSASTGVPMQHFGYGSDNASSADAIRLANERLDTRSVRRAHGFDLGVVELGMLGVLWRDGELPPLGSIGSRWRDPSTPTPAASADRAQKLVAAGVLPADSDVTLEQVGLTPEDIARVKADRRRSAGRNVLAAIRGAAAQPVTVPALDPASATGGQGGAGAVGAGAS